MCFQVLRVPSFCLLDKSSIIFNLTFFWVVSKQLFLKKWNDWSLTIDFSFSLFYPEILPEEEVYFVVSRNHRWSTLILFPTVFLPCIKRANHTHFLNADIYLFRMKPIISLWWKEPISVTPGLGGVEERKQSSQALRTRGIRTGDGGWPRARLCPLPWIRQNKTEPKGQLQK